MNCCCDKDCNCGCVKKGVCNCDCNVINPQIVQSVINKMPDDNTIMNLVDIYKSISDKTRLKILLALQIEEMCVYDIANVLNMTKSAVSHQLSFLRKSNLVTFNKIGKTCYYSIACECINEIINITKRHIN